MPIKYPHVKLDILPDDGSDDYRLNSLAVVGAVIRALRRAGVAPRDIDNYQLDALSGDYNHLMSVTMETADIL